MPKHHPQDEADKKGRSRQANRSTPQLEQVDNPLAVESLTGSLAMSGDPSVRNDAAQLGDTRIPRLQRQAFAEQIGSSLDNQYLLRVMSQMQRDEQAQGASPRQNQALSQAGSGSGSVVVEEKSLPNGARQRTTRMPFTHVIARSETGEQESATQSEEPVVIDELPFPKEPTASSLDSISSTLRHVSTITRGGAAPGGFGVTNSALSLTSVVIRRAAGVFTVTADLTHTITWQVRSATGPASQVDIASDTDPDLKAYNYQLAARDLTPDMSSDNGRPPRTAFWAEDLTIKHELFHTNQRATTYGPGATTAMQTWLNGQTATSAADIRSTLLPGAMAEGIRVFNAFVAAPTDEGDAYGDGAPFYLARATSIKTKGDAGDYGKISLTVTAHKAVGDNFLAGADDVFVELTLGGKTHKSGEQSMNDGDTKDFLVPANAVFSDTTKGTESVDIKVWDADSFLTGADDLLLSTAWTLPADTNVKSADGSYELTAKTV